MRCRIVGGVLTSCVCRARRRAPFSESNFPATSPQQWLACDLATPAAGYINGAVIHVDGGRTAV